MTGSNGSSSNNSDSDRMRCLEYTQKTLLTVCRLPAHRHWEGSNRCQGNSDHRWRILLLGNAEWGPSTTRHRRTSNRNSSLVKGSPKREPSSRSYRTRGYK
mmetsp:Transcript_31986/g.53980  ORF Transcript_31986/g.53980 Transcript_31986/m.53980 type:complete len:101 (-) Transcript_31986:73-375(-)